MIRKKLPNNLTKCLPFHVSQRKQEKLGEKNKTLVEEAGRGRFPRHQEQWTYTGVCGQAEEGEHSKS
jgi:hypothetical protein